MNYKYIIRKVKTKKNGLKYIPLVLTNGYWRYLIKVDDKFLASKNNVNQCDKLIDAYKFIATHRMVRNSKGKDRYKCLYYKENLSWIPLIGIVNIIKGLFHIKSGIPTKYLFSSPIGFVSPIIVQVMLLLFIILYI